MSVEELLNNYRGGGDDVSMPGAAIAEIMHQHRSDAEVQAAGCLALDQKICNEALGIGAAVAVSLAIAALQDHPNNIQTQYYSIGLIAQTAFQFRTEQIAIADAGAVPLIMMALREHADRADVQRVGFKAIAYLLDMSEDGGGDWTDIPFSSGSRMKYPAFRAIVGAGAAALLELVQARFPDDGELQRLAPVLLGVLRSDETVVLATIDSIIDNICIAHEPPVPENALKQQLSSAVAAGRYADAGVVSALQKWCGSDAAAERPVKKKKTGAASKQAFVCANPDDCEHCLRVPQDKSRRKIWKKHFHHRRMMLDLTATELSRVVKHNQQPPKELHPRFKSAAKYVLEKALCVATDTAAVELTAADVLCPNCFQHFIAQKMSE
jgi:hypothetical protein